MPPAISPEIRVRLAVDIGGTFTDVVLETPAARYSTKVLTHKATPEDGVLDGMRRALKLGKIEPGHIGLIVHGTTLATNAIIERKGAKTALVTTRASAIRSRSARRTASSSTTSSSRSPSRWCRARSASPCPSAPMPAAACGLRSTRRRSRRWPTRCKAKGVEAIAIGFLHSYANPAHERRTREILAASCPTCAISLSSEVCPRSREYERFSTTCANAYVQPLMARYLESCGSAAAGASRCPLLLMTSGGGLTTARDGACASRSASSNRARPAA